VKSEAARFLDATISKSGLGSVFAFIYSRRSSVLVSWRLNNPVVLMTVTQTIGSPAQRSRR
jgi:hypothetical protein